MALGKWFGKKKSEPKTENPSVESAPTEDKPEAKEKKGGFFSALKRGLTKTTKAIRNALPFGRKLDDETLEEIEATLIQADFGPKIALEMTEALSDSYKGKEFNEEEVFPFLKNRLIGLLGDPSPIQWSESGLTVILVTGVNGTGKTTSIAKLANNFKSQGKKVVLAAGDTFRAAAVEQLRIWSDRIGIEMVDGNESKDPAAVVYDALDRAIEIEADVLMIDTAGRLHTQTNLMAQLEKVGRVIKKRIPEAPHEVLQVLDATTGQNAIRQAEEFKKCIAVTGLVLTKLDGTAKGGVIFPILDQIGLPVKYIGVGEGIDDLKDFIPVDFVDALFAMPEEIA